MGVKYAEFKTEIGKNREIKKQARNTKYTSNEDRVLTWINS